jgi:hypothetical protein
MKKFALAALLLAQFNIANATIINFDDLTGDLSPVPDGYNGIVWNSSNLTGIIDVTPYLSPSVDYTGIENNALFNAYGYLGANTTIIKMADSSLFDFVSGYWSEGIAGDVQIKFEGYLNNNKVYTSSLYDLNLTSVSSIVLNWNQIDSLHINSNAAIWIADNIEIKPSSTSAVPVPAAAWLFMSGILGLMGLRRK